MGYTVAKQHKFCISDTYTDNFCTLTFLSVRNISLKMLQTAPALKDLYGRCSAVSTPNGFSPYFSVTLEAPAHEIWLLSSPNLVRKG